MNSMDIKRYVPKWNKLKAILGIDQRMLFSNEDVMASSKTIYNLERIPKRNRTEDMVKDVLVNDIGNVLALTPNKLITKELVLMQIKNSSENYSHIPRRFYDEGIIDAIFSNPKSDIWGLTLYLSDIFESMKKIELVEEYYGRALRLDVENFTAFDDKYISESMVSHYLKYSDYIWAESVPKRFWKNKDFKPIIDATLKRDRDLERQRELDELEFEARMQARQEARLLEEVEGTYIHPDGEPVSSIDEEILKERYDTWVSERGVGPKINIQLSREKVPKAENRYDTLDVTFTKFIEHLDISASIEDECEKLKLEISPDHGVRDRILIISNAKYKDADDIVILRKLLWSWHIILLDLPEEDNHYEVNGPMFFDDIIGMSDHTLVNHRGRCWFLVSNDLALEHIDDFIEIVKESSQIFLYGDSTHEIHDSLADIHLNESVFIGDVNPSLPNAHQVSNEDMKSDLYTYNVYDPYLGYADGAYEVSKESYLDYYRSLNMGSQIPNVSMPPIDITIKMLQTNPIMLVRGDYKMFFIGRKDGVTMLSGGAKRRSPKSLKYYYENMVEYNEKIKDIFNPLLDGIQKLGFRGEVISTNLIKLGYRVYFVIDLDRGELILSGGTPTQRGPTDWDEVRVGTIYHWTDIVLAKSVLESQPLVGLKTFTDDRYLAMMSYKNFTSKVFKDILFGINTGVCIEWFDIILQL